MQDSQTVPPNRQSLVAVGLVLGLVLSALDQTIVTTAMPTIARQLGGLSLHSWVFATMLFGKLADLFGRRRVHLAGMLFFMGGSMPARRIEFHDLVGGLQASAPRPSCPSHSPSSLTSVRPRSGVECRASSAPFSPLRALPVQSSEPRHGKARLALRLLHERSRRPPGRPSDLEGIGGTRRGTSRSSISLAYAQTVLGLGVHSEPPSPGFRIRSDVALCGRPRS